MLYDLSFIFLEKCLKSSCFAYAKWIRQERIAGLEKQRMHHQEESLSTDSSICRIMRAWTGQIRIRLELGCRVRRQLEGKGILEMKWKFAWYNETDREVKFIQNDLSHQVYCCFWEWKRNPERKTLEVLGPDRSERLRCDCNGHLRGEHAGVLRRGR